MSQFDWKRAIFQENEYFSTLSTRKAQMLKGTPLWNGSKYFQPKIHEKPVICRGEK